MDLTAGAAWGRGQATGFFFELLELHGVFSIEELLVGLIHQKLLVFGKVNLFAGV